MMLKKLSEEAQNGLRRFCFVVHHDELLLDDIGSNPEAWAWLCFQLRVAADDPEWFPKGKWATIQVIEQFLYDEAREAIRHD